MKRLRTFFFTLVVCSFTSNGQDSNASLGLGLGLDYGGIGAQVAIKADNDLALFGGIGTALAGPGFNVGVRYFFESKGSEQFFVHGMYGYNAVIVIQGMSSANKVYYGPSIGGGINLPNKNNTFWELAVNIPFRSSDFRNDWDDFNDDPNIEIGRLLPFTISIGYNFRL
ncbi:hypothetical protein [Ekhidna sp.]|uniref:hypothetical protein n=1 Tax=Ekhidna sp. TaxID=2608089 RepID=UPI003BAD043D